MERRVLIAVFLSFLVLYAYQAYFVPATPQKPPATATGQQAATPTAATATAATPADPQPATPSSEPAAAVVSGEPSEREVVVETKTVQVVFSNRGGRVTHWRLKNYAGDNGMPVDLVPTGVP